MKSDKNRKDYIDIAKGIGITLVVLGHSPHTYNPLKQWEHAFAMPLFFIISGMVWNKISHEKRGYFNKAFLLNKLKRLIVPCYIWAVLYTVLNFILKSSFEPMSFAYLLYGSQSGFSHAGSLTSLWFLPCMFIAVSMFEIIQQSLRNISRNNGILLAVSAVCALSGFYLPKIPGGYPWSLDVSFLAVAFMIWGYLGKSLIEKTVPHQSVTFICGLLSLTVLTFTFRFNLPYISINNADMAGRHFGHPAIYLLDAIAGSLFVVFTSMLSAKSEKIKSLFVRLGKHTIPILLIHKPIVQLLGKIFGKTTAVYGTAFMVIEILVAVAVSEIVYKLTSKYLPVLYGEDSGKI